MALFCGCGSSDDAVMNSRLSHSHQHVDRSRSPTEDVAQQIRILTYNIYIRPPGIKSNASDHKVRSEIGSTLR